MRDLIDSLNNGYGACVIKSVTDGKLYNFKVDSDDLNEQLRTKYVLEKDIRYFYSADGEHLTSVALDLGW